MKNTLICLILTIFLFSCKEDDNPFSEIYISNPDFHYVDPGGIVNLKIPYDAKYSTEDLKGHLFMDNNECVVEVVSDREFKMKIPENIVGGHPVTHNLNGNQQRVIFGDQYNDIGSGFYVLKKLGDMKIINTEEDALVGKFISNGEKVLRFESGEKHGTTKVYSFDPDNIKSVYATTIDLADKYLEDYCLSPKNKNIVYFFKDRNIYEFNFNDFTINLVTNSGLSFDPFEDYAFTVKGDDDHIYLFYKAVSDVNNQRMFLVVKFNINSNKFSDVGNLLMSKEDQIYNYRQLNGVTNFIIQNSWDYYIYNPETNKLVKRENDNMRIIFENDSYIYYYRSSYIIDESYFIEEYNKDTKESLYMYDLKNKDDKCICFLYELKNKKYLRFGPNEYWIWDINAK